MTFQSPSNPPIGLPTPLPIDFQSPSNPPSNRRKSLPIPFQPPVFQSPLYPIGAYAPSGTGRSRPQKGVVQAGIGALNRDSGSAS